MKEYVAIIDDEEDIGELVDVHLKKNNYQTGVFYNATDFLNSLKKKLPDLIILDLMLPDMDGIEVCKILKNSKEYKKIAVIMLTAKQDEIDKIIGLEIGADDYVTKPFSPRELVARVKAVLRRNSENQEDSEENLININDLIFVDLRSYQVTDDKNNIINLTSTEFKILQILAGKRGWVFSREKLIAHIWGEERYVIERTIDVHIKNLREKLGEAGKLIKNVRSVGYKLDV